MNAEFPAAGKDAVGLFFYAGHGVQVRGQNYLISHFPNEPLI